MSTGNNRQGEGGSGSAENRSEDRQAQKNQQVDLTGDDKQNLANEIGVAPEAIGDVEDLGAVSGRDDAAGGSGDNMTNASGNQPTDKL